MTERRSRRAALLDRDGTIIVDRNYLRDPAGVELLPGAAEAIRTLAAAGFPTIVCTNQSGIARGLVSLADYRAVRRRMEELLAAEGAEIVDTFTCPHHPLVFGPCACRKPATEMFERAAMMHELDLSRCFYVGDKMRDASPSLVFGGRGALVISADTPDEETRQAKDAGLVVASSLAEAVGLLIAPAT